MVWNQSWPHIIEILSEIFIQICIPKKVRQCSCSVLRCCRGPPGITLKQEGSTNFNATVLYWNLHTVSAQCYPGPGHCQVLTGFLNSNSSKLLFARFLQLPWAHFNTLPCRNKTPWRQDLYLPPSGLESVFGKYYRISWCVRRKRGEIGLRTASFGVFLFFLRLGTRTHRGQFERCQTRGWQWKVITEKSGCSGGRCYLQ